MKQESLTLFKLSNIFPHLALAARLRELQVVTFLSPGKWEWRDGSKDLRKALQKLQWQLIGGGDHWVAWARAGPVTGEAGATPPECR